jgi:RNA-directed DNA polymerase
MSPSLYARVDSIARAFALGPLDGAAMIERAMVTTNEPARRLAPLAQKVARAFGDTTRPRVRDIAALPWRDREWLRTQLTAEPPVRRRGRASRLDPTPVMVPVTTAREWPLPALTTLADLSTWLGITLDELAWFSNCAGFGAAQFESPRHHYHYRLSAKPHGGIRVLEAPQRRLKALQRQILTQLLNAVPPFYSAAHGFVRGRSVRTFAAEHVQKSVVLRMDLVDFFPSVSGVRVQALFRTLGYPEPVADALGGLCTSTVPAGVFATSRWPALHPTDLRDAMRVFARPHLPQGAPTSPAIANLCAYRLDCRLTGLADWAGGTYSRYADDLAFSGDADVARRTHEYAAQIGAIALEEGWAVQHHKTRVMRQSSQQRLTGLVVNTAVNCPRRDVDQLRAILTNSVRHGPASQNRDGHRNFCAHLAGRVAWVRSVNERRAQRLQGILDRIDWTR